MENLAADLVTERTRQDETLRELETRGEELEFVHRTMLDELKWALDELRLLSGEQQNDRARFHVNALENKIRQSLFIYSKLDAMSKTNGIFTFV